MSDDHLKLQFASPGNRFRFAPFWFLNHELTEAETRWQIQEMERQGVGGFILHARHGLLTEYMSEAWMRQMEVAVAEAKRLGMKAYLYDENNWPSGPADGKVIEENPEFRMSGMRVTQEFRVRGGERVEKRLDFDDELVGVVAVPFENGTAVGFPESAVELAEQVEGDVLRWEAPPGEWHVYVLGRKWFVGLFFGGYLDTLNEEAVRRFIELTHLPYIERLGQEMGGALTGIFTDEPTMNFNGPERVPYTGALPATFEWRTGQPFVRCAPALFRDLGPATAKLRCDFYDTATELYVSAYFKQIYEVCDRARLATMGHVMQEGELVEHTRQQGDWFRGARYMHWGGCDFLCELTWPSRTEHLNNLLGPKFASSGAHLLGKEIVGCECFGLASSWGIDLRNLKWMVNWQAALGINVMEPHAFYYSIQGFRKWECPPGEFYQSPFWPFYRTLADYAGRLCAMLTGGKHVADVALLYPIRSLWAELDPHNNDTVAALVDNFEVTSRALLQLNFDFDIVSEEMLWEADFADGEIGIKGPDGEIAERFKVLVMPAVTTVSRRTLEALRNFVAAGGRILATGRLPTNSSERGEDAEVAEVFEVLFGEDYAVSQTVVRKRRPVISEQFRQGWREGLLIGLPRGVEDADVWGPLGGALNAVLEPDVRVEADGRPVPEIVHYHYVRDSRHLFLLVNTSREQSLAGTADLNAAGAVEVWDIETGKAERAYTYDSANGRTRLPLHFAPTQAHLVCIDTDQPAAELRAIKSEICITSFRENRIEGLVESRGKFAVTPAWNPDEAIILEAKTSAPRPVELGGEWQFWTEKPNALPLRDWGYRMEAHRDGRDHSNARHMYTTTLQADLVPEEARLLLDGLAVERVWRKSAPVSYEVRVNGEAVGPFEPGEYLDHYIWEATLDGKLKAGANEIAVTTVGNLYETPNLAHPPILVGRFAVIRRRGREVLVAEPGKLAVGSWHEQGYPYYSGVGVYSRTFNLPARLRGLPVRLEWDAIGDLAEVFVNGKSCGVRAWEPWSLDVTKALKAGRNALEIRVANSLQNLLCEEPKPSGLLSVPRLRALIPVRKKLG